LAAGFAFGMDLKKNRVIPAILRDDHSMRLPKANSLS
jgi:hypothetical protein